MLVSTVIPEYPRDYTAILNAMRATPPLIRKSIILAQIHAEMLVTLFAKAGKEIVAGEQHFQEMIQRLDELFQTIDAGQFLCHFPCTLLKRPPARSRKQLYPDSAFRPS